MSGLRDINLVEAYRLLHGRGLDTTTIAAAVHTSRAYVSRVLSGYERRGPTWRRIRDLLTPEEVALLEAVPERDPQRTVLRAKACLTTEGTESTEAKAKGGSGATINTARPTVRAFETWRNKAAS